MFCPLEGNTNLSQAGLKVTRVWGFGNVNTPVQGSVYFQVLNKRLSSTGQYFNFDQTTGTDRR